jgi:hypothetical protein
MVTDTAFVETKVTIMSMHSTAGTISAPVRSLRMWSSIGAALLVVGVFVLTLGAVFWKPLSSAPGVWTTGIWGLVGTGLVVTIIATATLAATSRQR